MHTVRIIKTNIKYLYINAKKTGKGGGVQEIHGWKLRGGGLACYLNKKAFRS